MSDGFVFINFDKFQFNCELLINGDSISSINELTPDFLIITEFEEFEIGELNLRFCGFKKFNNDCSLSILYDNCINYNFKFINILYNIQNYWFELNDYNIYTIYYDLNTDMLDIDCEYLI
ncbi:MAG: hypothetical protein ACOC3T_01275, partial [Bacteroidota bacterium]